MKRLSEELDNAIRMLFDDPEVGYNAFGSQTDDILHSIGLQTEKDVSSSIDPLLRIAMLRRELENWVELKGVEIDEYVEGEDTIRIQSEALATLMVLRDLAKYFPEVETADRSEFEKFKRDL